MSRIPYAPVTCVDGTASLGAVEALVVPVDYRFAGEVANIFTYAGTQTAGDSIIIQVSPDWHENATAGALWVNHTVTSATSFVGNVYSPWAAVRVLKTGTGSSKVVGLVAGRSRSRPLTRGT